MNEYDGSGRGDDGAMMGIRMEKRYTIILSNLDMYSKLMAPKMRQYLSKLTFGQQGTPNLI